MKGEIPVQAAANSIAVPEDTDKPAKPVRPSAGRIPQLDGLRGVAILLVILYHYIAMADPAGRETALAYVQDAFKMGWCGVDLFFVLSGFLIGGILLDAKHSPWFFKTFYRRRILRIFPLYYLWIGLYFLLALTPLLRWTGPMGIVPTKWTAIPVYTLFLQNVVWHREPAYWTVWLSPLWSLAVEEQFYLAMPCLVRFSTKCGLVTLLFITVAGAPIVRILAFKYLGATHPAAPYMLTPCRADALALGVLVAVGWREERLKKWAQSHLKLLLGVIVMLLGGVIYLAIANPTQYTHTMAIWGFSCVDSFFAGLLILALLAPNGFWARFCRLAFLRDIGIVSYCIYIIHTFINSVCHYLISSSANGVSTFSSFGATLIAAVATWLLAKLSWHYFESPMVRLAHRYRY